jgi:hypothetical protein
MAVNMAVTAAKEREQDGKGRNDIVLVENGREIQEVEGEIAIVTMLYRKHVHAIIAMSLVSVAEYKSESNAGTSGARNSAPVTSTVVVLMIECYRLYMNAFYE